MENTGADANDEFARWLAETAKAGQAAAPATPAQPVAPAAPVPPAFPPPSSVPGAMPPPAALPPAAPPPAAPPPDAPPPAPEFFGADQPAPPTRPYEAPFAGPQIARTSFQPTAGDPPIPPAPAPVASPPAATIFPAPPAAPISPSSHAAPITPAAPLPPGPPAAASAPPSTPPAWAPGFVVPAPEAPPAAPAPPDQGLPFFPPPDAAPGGFAPPAPVQPTGAPVAPVAGPTAPVAPAYTAPVAPPASPPAAFPPPAPEAPAAPVLGERPADEDALSSLFGGLGTETAEAPVPTTAELFASTPFAPPPPVHIPEPAFVAEPVLPPAPAPAPPLAEPVYVPPVAAPTPDPGVGYAPGYSAEPPPSDDPTAGTQFFGGGTGDYEEPPDLDRTTTGEKAAFALAFLVPPVGLIGSIVAAAQSSRRRGWVHGFVRAALVISLITTIAAGIAGAFGYKALEDQRRHDALAAASTQFCSTVAEQPDMISPPTFGFPSPGNSIPETIAGIQAYADKFDALAAVSPSGIRPDVTRVADAARDILSTIESTRLIDDASNVANMTNVAESTHLVAWARDYCG